MTTFTKTNKRRHFLLLEVMIAMFLILLCAVPALKLYVDMYLAQRDTVRIYARDQVAEQIHATLIERFYKNTIALESLLSDHNTEHPLNDPPCEEALKKLGFTCHCTLKITNGQKHKDSEKHLHYLCQMKIDIIDELPLKKAELLQTAEYNYVVYIDRGCRDKTHPHYQKSPTP